MTGTDFSSIPESSPAVSIQRWWVAIQEDFDRFFLASEAFSPGVPTSRFTQILIDLETARVNIQAMPYPIVATEARRYLIEAITSVLKGFAAAIEQNTEKHNDSMRQAQKYLNLFDSVMEEFGIHN